MRTMIVNSKDAESNEFLKYLAGLANGDIPGLKQFMQDLADLARKDVSGLKTAHKSYKNSWKKRGGIGAYMMAIRKIDRMEARTERYGWDIFKAILKDNRREGVIDDVRDLRRYLLLIEAEMLSRGFNREHRDNKKGGTMKKTSPKSKPEKPVKKIVKKAKTNKAKA